MLCRVWTVALATLALSAPATAQDAATVAGRPALSTSTTQDLIAQRERWGTAPGTRTPAKGEPPLPAKAVKATAAAYAVLPTDDVTKLIAEREKWGKGPAGYEKKKVVAPRAAGTASKEAKRAKLKTKAKAKKTAKKKIARKRHAKARKKN